MMVLVSYDIQMKCESDAKRLRRIAKICQDYGLRAQYSLFECNVPPDLWVKFKNRLLEEYDSKCDSLRFYFLGSNWEHKVEHHGSKKVTNIQKDVLMI